MFNRVRPRALCIRTVGGEGRSSEAFHSWDAVVPAAKHFPKLRIEAFGVSLSTDASYVRGKIDGTAVAMLRARAPNVVTRLAHPIFL